MIADCQPTVIYNMADQDDVRASYSTAGYSYDVTGAAVGRLLQGLSDSRYAGKFFQPISATIYGEKTHPIKKGSTDYDPQSPYACAKLFALYLCRYYRQFFPVTTCTLFNHDSPRRGEGYLLQRIGEHVARLSLDMESGFEFYDLRKLVDVGDARKYVKEFPKMIEYKLDHFMGNCFHFRIWDLLKMAYKLAGVRFDLSGDLSILPDYGLFSGQTLEGKWRGSSTDHYAGPIDDLMLDIIQEHKRRLTR